MSIQRYDFLPESEDDYARDTMQPTDDGDWIKYADHLAALTAERERAQKVQEANRVIEIEMESARQRTEQYKRAWESTIESHVMLYQERDALRADHERLTAWVDDLQSGMYVNCVYCGHRYGPGETTPVSMSDALKAHVEQCPQHPMSALRAENERLRADAERYRWLRNNPLHPHHPYVDDGHWHFPYQVSNAGGSGGGVGLATFNTLDEAIDAARGEGMDDGKQSTPAEELERQICSATEPKNEREWWAHHEIARLLEISRLRAELLEASKAALTAARERADRAEDSFAWAGLQITAVTAERDALRERVARLQDWVERAPHRGWCTHWSTLTDSQEEFNKRYGQFGDGECTCGKSTALEGK